MQSSSGHPLSGTKGLDDALARIWSLYKAHFITLFTIPFVIFLIAQYIPEALGLSISPDDIPSDPAMASLLLRRLMLNILTMLLLHSLAYVIIYYYILKIPEGISSIGSLAKESITRYYLTFLIVGVLLIPLFAIAAFIGIIILFIGALFTLLWALTVSLFIPPLLMSEGNLIGHSITRAFALMHRNFWSSIGWTAVVVLIIIVVLIAGTLIIFLPFGISLISEALAGGGLDQEALQKLNSNPIYIILSTALSALVAPFVILMSWTLYFRAVEKEQAETILSDTSEDQNV